MTDKNTIANVRNALQPVCELLDYIDTDARPLRAQDLLPCELRDDARQGFELALALLAELESG